MGLLRPYSPRNDEVLCYTHPAMAFTVTLVKKTPVTSSVTAFYFAKPQGFIFQPGQFINLEIPVTDCDNRCNKRNFSVAAAPFERYLMIAIRNGTSRFKQTLQDLPVGTEVKLVGPMGRFVLNEEVTQPAAMLTGGIGITPLFSMLKHATHEHLKKPLTLIFSNKSQSDIPFKTELDELDRKNDFLTIHHTLTDDETWGGHKGRIDEQVIKKLIRNWQSAEYYLCGPMAMVEELKAALLQMQIPDELVKFEQFTGY